MRRSSTHDGHGAVTSWPDHILTLQHHSSTIMEVAGVHSACNLSDHVPLAFSVNIDLNYSSTGPSRCPASRSFSCAVDWSRVTSAELDRYIEAIRMNLPVVPTKVSLAIFGSSGFGHKTAFKNTRNDK